MDLLAIAGTLWRHKLVTIPVILLTLIGAFYVIEIKPPAYAAKASILLTNPPAPPTAAQIAAHPSLGHVNSNNPYASLGNLVLVADVVIEVVTSPTAKQALVQAGANPQYQVALDLSFDSPPAIDITGVATTPGAATQSAQLVANAVSGDLYQLQVSQHTSPGYMIGSIEYVKPTSATASSSSKLRTLIIVVVLGFIVLLVAVSTAQVLEQRRSGRKPRQGRQPAVRANDYGSFEEPRNGPATEMYNAPQWAAGPMNESQPASPARRSHMHPVRGNDHWGAND
jgi:capsular polysaccharide biosynthesis protein